MSPAQRAAVVKASTAPREETTDQGSDRRAALVALAADLFAERGYKATTVRDIADAAGVLSGSLYYHFASKEAIIDELLSQYLDELLASTKRIVRSGGTPADCFAMLVREAFDSLSEHRAAITVLQNERQVLIELPRFAYLQPRQAEIRKLWMGVMTRAIRSGEFRRDLDASVAYRMVRDSVWVAVRWFDPEGALSSDALAEQYIAMFLSGFGGPAAPKAGSAPPASALRSR